MKREYPNRPIMGVGGIISHQKHVLLVKRGQNPEQREWRLPGGVVELGETLFEALHREILEETCVDIRIGDLAGLRDYILYFNDNHFLRTRRVS